MSSEELQNELTTFLEQYPETRFMDVFSPDINGVLRGKRIQRGDFASVFGAGSNFCAASVLMNTMGQSSDNVIYGSRDGDPDIKSFGVPGSLAPVPWAALPTAQCLLDLKEFDGSDYFPDTSFFPNTSASCMSSSLAAISPGSSALP